MIKYIATIKVQVGDKAATFTGRMPQPVDADVKPALLSIGIFTETPDGELYYSAGVEVPMADGTTRQPDARGFIACAKTDLANPDDPSFQ
jgi:hypothetical protein